MKLTTFNQSRNFAIVLAVGLIVSVPPQSFADTKIKAKLGLSMTQYFGYANNDDTGTGDFSGFDVKQDTEVSFGGDVTLENGIQVGVEVILDGNQSDEQIKDTYLWTEGEFGRFEIGNTDNAAAKMHYAAPDVGFGVNDADIGDWIVNPTSGDADSAFSSTYLYLGESRGSKISWFSPRISGVQIGTSYIPEFSANTNSHPNAKANYNGAIAVGANFVQNFDGGNELALSAGYLTADSPKNTSLALDLEGVSAGFSLTMGDLTVGGSIANTDGTPEGGTNIANSLEGRGIDLGISYVLDPATVSLSYYQGAFEGAVETAGDSTNETIMASINYEIADGISGIASVFHAQFEDENGSKNEGTAVLAGLSVEF